MITEARQHKILKLLDEHTFVGVASLANTFGVSPETIRRDLAALEDLGRLRRVHGGAALPDDQQYITPPSASNPPLPSPSPSAPPLSDIPQLNWYSPTRTPFKLCGFPFFMTDGVYRRYPLNPPETLPKGVEQNAWGTSGGQIRFSAELSKLYIRVKLTRAPSYTYNTTALAAAGFDLYASDGDGYYSLCGITKFDTSLDCYEAPLLNIREKRKLDLIINFPLRTGVESVLIGIDGNPEKPPEFSNDSRILVYGGSIMHGFCASRPGMTMENILSRRLNREVINLGVNGSAKCEREAALAVRMVDNVDLFIISPEGNCPSVEWLREHMTEFIELYREKNPATMIAVMSYMRQGLERFDSVALEQRLSKKQCQREIVEKFRSAGDDRIVFWDGEEFTQGREDIYFHEFGAGDECTTDTQHKSDLGFWLMANGVFRRIKGE